MEVEPAGPRAAQAAPVAAPPVAPASAERLPAILEAALFAHEGPVSLQRLSDSLQVPAGTVRAVLGELAASLEAAGRGLQVAEVAGGFALVTRPDLAPWVEAVTLRRRERRLTPATLETLATVAYKQPLTRVEIEAVRGVNCGAILRQLIELELVRVVGRSEALGRAVLYGTTPTFLKRFGLGALSDLPRPDALE